MVRNVTHDELEDWIDMLYDNRSLAGFIHGTTGIGKSVTVREKSEEIADNEHGEREFVQWDELSLDGKENVIENAGDYFVFTDVRLSDMDASDIKGIPLLEGDYTDWKPPMWAKALSQEEAAGVLFFDEFNLAPELVQSSFYQVILDRMVSQERLSDDVLILGAGNMEGDRANIHQMPGPLRNRFSHVELTKPIGGTQSEAENADLWIDWAIENGIDERITSYVGGSSLGKDKLFTFDDEKESFAFATPRTWEFASDLIKDLTIQNDEEEMRLAVSSTVGEGVAREFMKFVELQDDLNIMEYIENPEMGAEIEDRFDSWDKRYAVITGIAAHCKDNPSDMPNAFKFTKHMDNNELQTLQLKLIKSYNEEKFTHYSSKDSFTKMFQHLTGLVAKK